MYFTSTCASFLKFISFILQCKFDTFNVVWKNTGTELTCSVNNASKEDYYRESFPIMNLQHYICYFRKRSTSFKELYSERERENPNTIFLGINHRYNRGIKEVKKSFIIVKSFLASSLSQAYNIFRKSLFQVIRTI